MQLCRSLARYRTEFGRQAARNAVKLYESRPAVQSEDYRAVLDSGLEFAQMVAAFCAEQVDSAEAGAAADEDGAC